ncbi:asparagine synthase [Halalkalicoccus paucihalophilus]|uniref:Asparagine synthase n=1 Tax=Halalkalicoccus paucihalophilus TaxID=1008153 RepID=A0A151A9J2_9EURY|nr:asparagine synthase-related protein [Halalkalicoccus paucihalophilus]KYH24368.1 asparagine synthase [Halalkalicoccus paucihalophilus]
MKSELFGVFGTKSDFDQLRSSADFDRIITGNSVVVGIRDPTLDSPGRTSTHVDQSSSGLCVVYGDVFLRGESVAVNSHQTTAATLYNTFLDWDFDALGLDQLNGSYLAVLDTEDKAIIATDPISSRECFYTETPVGRVFGTDLSQLVRVQNVFRDELQCNEQGLREFLQFGVVFGDQTTLKGVNRIPFDGYLTATTTGTLARFVYEPQAFDYVTELATRLEHAIKYRGQLSQEQATTAPDTKTGLLLSAGFDSRVILAALPEGTIDICYTIGSPETPEVRVAQKVAAQYGAEHVTLPVTTAYLDISPEVTQYTNGLRESLHIHHRGHRESIAVDQMFHGLFLDTLLRNRYIPRETLTIPLLNRKFPLSDLAKNPDIPALFEQTFGFESGDRILDEFDVFSSGNKQYSERSGKPIDPEQYLHETIEREYQAGFTRTDSPHNAAALLGIKCKSSLPFRSQLSDQYTETLIAADAGLLEWHLQTPPEYRTDRTYQEALKRIDSDIFRYRPPDRPHRTYQANQVEKFVRKIIPGISTFGTPWPDRDEIYAEANLDREFMLRPDLQGLSTRSKLRIRDAKHWGEFIEII